ncbi:MAG: hypothetical protein K5768_05605 [Firmicutes bacterium]|nr:hypothetical protein [Bacillota bacterium]
MDILVKNNIVKWNKIIVDVGVHTTKILNVHYAAKQVIIKSAERFDTGFINAENELNFEELADRVDMNAQGRGRKDISITLPDFLVDSRIVSIKNKKENDVDGIIRKEYMHFGRVSPLTHVVDYAFLGKREESGDTVRYYLVSAIQKSIANELVSAFAKRKMKITTISCGVYNQYCLSELFFDEYEHLNRMLIDFGTNSTRITAFADGVAVYTRTIERGFNTYVNTLFDADSRAGMPEIRDVLYTVGFNEAGTEREKECLLQVDDEIYFDSVEKTNNALCGEIKRVIDLCATNDVAISKIYCTGFLIKGFDGILKSVTGLECEPVSFGICDEKSGREYVLVSENGLDIKYSNALGMAVCPML